MAAACGAKPPTAIAAFKGGQLTALRMAAASGVKFPVAKPERIGGPTCALRTGAAKGACTQIAVAVQPHPPIFAISMAVGVDARIPTVQSRPTGQTIA
jgi:hypothetical protein